MSRFARLLPLLILVTTGFAVYQLYIAVVVAMQRSWPFALFFGVFGAAGLAISKALWDAWMKVRKAAAR